MRQEILSARRQAFEAISRHGTVQLLLGDNLHERKGFSR